MKLTVFWEHLDKFLKFIRLSRCLTNNTYRAYKADLVLFGQFWTENHSDAEIQIAVNNFIVSLLYNQSLSAKSVARKFSSLKTFAKFIARKGVELNVVGKSPRIRTSLPDILSVQEVAELGKALQDNVLKSFFPKRDRLIFELLYATGMRSFEMSGVKVEEIDLENKTIRVWGKGMQERIVLFGERAKNCIVDYLNTERPKHKKNPNGYLLVNWRKGKLETRGMRKIFENISTLLDTGRKITPHTMRHSFATHMLSQGVDLRVVQELLGHKRISATQIYTQISLQSMSDFFKTNHPLNSNEEKQLKALQNKVEI